MVTSPGIGVIVSTCALCVILIGAGPAWGWGPFAHSSAAADPILSDYANLPDFWGRSWEVLFDQGGLCPQVKPLFPLTHGCQRNGYTDMVPATPTRYEEPAGVETLECDMSVMINKMTVENHPTEGFGIMSSTAQGFRAHNTVDQKAHFTLFQGGSLANWVKHAFLEEYFDLRLFDDWVGYGSPFGVSSFGHAGIITLAEKCFRKNRQTIDNNPTTCQGGAQPGPVDSRSTNTNYLLAQALEYQEMEYSQSNEDWVVVELAAWGMSLSQLEMWLTTSAIPTYLDAVGSMNSVPCP